MYLLPLSTKKKELAARSGDTPTDSAIEEAKEGTSLEPREFVAIIGSISALCLKKRRGAGGPIFKYMFRT